MSDKQSGNTGSANHFEVMTNPYMYYDGEPAYVARFIGNDGKAYLCGWCEDTKLPFLKHHKSVVKMADEKGYNLPLWIEIPEFMRKNAMTNESLGVGTESTKSGVWVKCSERLPELGQRVILMSQGVVQNFMPIFDEDEDGIFWDFDEYCDGDVNPSVNILRDRWMPVPELPDQYD